MQLPNDWAGKVVAWLESANISHLRKATQHLTYQYQTRQKPVSMMTPDQHLAYIAARMPATFQVCKTVLSHIRACKVDVTSILDLGAGPGTASLAGLESFPQLTAVTLVDKDPYFRSLALELLSQTGCLIQYELSDIASFKTQTKYDLVFCSYALNELNAEDLQKAMIHAWHMTNQFLVLVEPGTPYSFSILKRIRQFLIEEGAFVVAPCTHHQKCPLIEGDWCHFSVHVMRSDHHRLSKKADLSYEHEKYTYIIFSRQPFERPTHRIIKRPIHRSGHVIFDLCGESGVHRSVVSKKYKDRYTFSRKQVWGDGWNEEND